MRIAVLLILIGVISRLLSLPHGLSLTAAVILLAGAYLPWRQVVAVALGVMVLSDLVKGIHHLVPWTWSGALLIGAVALILRRKSSYQRAALASLAASTAYYLWSTLGVWLIGGCVPKANYLPTLTTLFETYTRGFLHYLYSLVGNLCFTLVLFAIAKNLLKWESAYSLKPIVNQVELKTHE